MESGTREGEMRSGGNWDVEKRRDMLLKMQSTANMLMLPGVMVSCDKAGISRETVENVRKKLEEIIHAIYDDRG